MRIAIIAITAGVLFFAACGGDDGKGSGSSTDGATTGSAAPKERAGDAVKRQLGQVDKGQFGPEWDELHPAQQALVPRDLYIQCAHQAGLPQIDKIKVTDTYDEEVIIPGTGLKAPSTAVSVTYTLHQGAQSLDSKATFHEFAVNGKWRWMLSDIESYKAGKCP